jgi:uncharacterized membrane protein
MKKDEYIQSLMRTENEHLRKLNKIVTDAIQEQELLSSQIKDADLDVHLTFGERMADKVAEFGGSWRFIILFGIFILIWICINIFLLRSGAFDPYPFILLNLILSCLAALQAPIIMMSQNRQETKDRKRSENDYLVNLKSEIEIRNLHQKVNLLIEEQIKVLIDIQERQIEMLQSLEKKLDKHLKH